MTVNPNMEGAKLAARELAEAAHEELIADHDRAFAGLRCADARTFLDLGLPENWSTFVGWPGAATIQPSGSGRFEFADQGRRCLILPVYDSLTLAWHPPLCLREGLLDLLAFQPDQPKQWWLRRGTAVLLGSSYIPLVLVDGGPLPVYPDPVAWLRAAGEGVVVLGDWDCARELLIDVDHFIVDGVKIGERLERILKPTIWVEGR